MENSIDDKKKLGNEEFNNLSVADKLKKVFYKLQNNLVLVFVVVLDFSTIFSFSR